MPKWTPEMVYDYEAVTFDVRGYLRSLKLSHKDIAHTLRITAPQLSMWCHIGKMPRSAQRVAFKLWGHSGFNEPPTSKQKRPYILDAQLYGPYVGAHPTNARKLELLQKRNGIELVKEPAPPPPPPPLPDAVPRQVYEDSVALLLYQNSQVLAESALIQARNTELENRVAYLENQAGMTRTLEALDRVRREPPPMKSDRSVALEMIHRTAAAQNGAKTAVSELEKRLQSFPSGPRL